MASVHFSDWINAVGLTCNVAGVLFLLGSAAFWQECSAVWPWSSVDGAEVGTLKRLSHQCPAQKEIFNHGRALQTTCENQFSRTHS
jgi:hypothetical protein